MVTRHSASKVSARPPLSTPMAQTVDARTDRDPATVRTLRCRTVAQGRFSQLHHIRDLPPQQVAKNETEGLLAEETAPNASEALLAALGQCLAAGIHANAIARHIPIKKLEVHMEADIDKDAVWGAGDRGAKPIGFEAIRVSVRILADAPQDTLDALVKHATLWSPVANTLHNPVHLDVEVAAIADA